MTSSNQNKIISVNELWQFFNRSANLFCISGADGYLKQVNPYVVKLLGYDEEELLSIPYLHFIHEEDRAHAAAQSEKVRKEGNSLQFRTRVIMFRGGVKWISWTATYVADEDNVYLIGQDLTDRITVEENLRDERLSKQKSVLEATLLGQEKERAAIGKELHDNVVQILATSVLYQQMAIREQENASGFIQTSAEIVQQAIHEIRSLSKALVGPDILQTSLFESIRDLLESVQCITRLTTFFNWTGDIDILPAKAKLMVYRIIQEQLNNIVKHAEANSVYIELCLDDNGLSLKIEDDGKGFDLQVKRTGIGLRNIHSRLEMFDGSLDIDTAIGKGCRLSMMVTNEMLLTA